MNNSSTFLFIQIYKKLSKLTENEYFFYIFNCQIIHNFGVFFTSFEVQGEKGFNYISIWLLHMLMCIDVPIDLFLVDIL